MVGDDQHPTRHPGDNTSEGDDMSTRVEKSTTVNVPVRQAYNQWTQFEEFPQFMDGVESVTQVEDDRLDWVAEIGGVRRHWEARIVEQVPDSKVAWVATQGTTNAGAVTFEELAGGQTSVTLVLDYEPEGLVEKVGDALDVVERQAEADLERFKAFIESEGEATGAWRGSVGTPGSTGTPSGTTPDEPASEGWTATAGAGWTSASNTPGVGAVRMLSEDEIEQGAITSPRIAASEPGASD
jgi:uncharacterized membrane protein